VRGISRVVDLVKARAFFDTLRGPRAVSRDLGLPVELADSHDRDAFGRLRTSQPYVLFDAQNEYNASNLFWEDKLTGTATAGFLPNESAIDLTVSANGDKAIRQSRQYLRYQPLRSHLVVLTTVPGEPEIDLRRRWGLFDDQNGIFFESLGSTVSIVRRSFTSGGVVDDAVPQSQWGVARGTDRLDGSGLSRFSLSQLFNNIYAMDLQWLSAGAVRVGVMVGRELLYAHEFANENTLTTPYMTTANLPVRYEIEALAAPGATKHLKSICAAVVSEGGFEIERGIPNSVAMTAVKSVPIASGRVPLISIRPKSTFGPSAKVVRGQIIPESIAAIAGSGSALITAVYNPTTLTAAAFASAGTDSIVDFDTAATAITGGTVLPFQFYASGAAAGARGVALPDLLSRLPLTLDIAGANPIALTICAQSLGGTIDAAAAINFRELY
jgi:hypothetical protein